MKNVPKSYLILALLLISLTGCGDRKENTVRPIIDQPVPKEQIRDNNDSLKRPEIQIPGDQAPGKAKKNSNSELDTLRPIKA